MGRSVPYPADRKVFMDHPDHPTVEGERKLAVIEERATFLHEESDPTPKSRRNSFKNERREWRLSTGVENGF